MPNAKRRVEEAKAWRDVLFWWHRNPGGWGDKKWREEYEERHRRWREARDHDGRRNVEGS